MELALELNPVSLIGFARRRRRNRIHGDEPGDRRAARAEILFRKH